ncbi:MAG: HAMP domain-containing histidine kinase [Chloroflexi bacterium]|nr:HAMP domain-containing histidine kinase [Chloroflexota bacterium]
MVLRSLRSRLIVSYILIIFLCLFLAGSAFLYLLRDYQQQLALNRLADLSLPVSWQIRILERGGVPPAQISSFLQEQAAVMNVRILLMDAQGLVVEDTQGDLKGRTISIPHGDILRLHPRTFWTTYQEGSGQSFLLVTVATQPVSPFNERFVSRSPAYSVVLAVPQQSVSSAWLELAPSLSLAALVSLAISIVIAWLLSRSIAGPVVEVTRASEEMAKGNYQQSISVRGSSEIRRLATAFNAMAQQVNVSHRTLRDFLANISHGLKTPLTSIQGFSQAMVDGALNEPEGYAEAGRIINEEANRMGCLVDDLLNLSKLEAGQLPLEKHSLDLAELLRACIRRVERRAGESSIELVSQLPSLPSFEGDERWLEQAFDNLLDNALRHTPQGGRITVTLGERTKDERGRMQKASGSSSPSSVLCVSVHNTGSYISAKDLPHIFERFYQVDESRARAGGGSGLGLAIVKEVIEAHGGMVEAKSDPKSGVELLVTLPLGQTTV